jgi:putative transposase
MPRRARLMLAGLPVHITHRGNNRQRCFYEECDRAFYLFHLLRLLPHARCALHAYCLMSNHVHLLVTPATGESCARLMKGIAQLHTQYVNRTYRRTGTLWEGRFHSCLVQSENYLLTCYTYIELNPVEAGLCDQPEHYEWSSCRANAHGTCASGITPHDEYLKLGGTADARQAAPWRLDVAHMPERLDDLLIRLRARTIRVTCSRDRKNVVCP